LPHQLLHTQDQAAHAAPVLCRNEAVLYLNYHWHDANPVVCCTCRIKQHMQQLLGADGLLALPTAPGPAIACDATQQQQNEFRKGLLSLTCIAGLSGLPQVRFQIVQI
jgi:Asp-tRNA(Asn)/Glu-tRNA(Gln) amidotransferase A subunit family amidase